MKKNIGTYNKKKYLLIPAFAVLALLGGGAALAQGGMGGMFLGDPTVAAQRFDSQMSEHASLLGISVDEMKNYWSQGKNLEEIAKEKGISDTDLQAKMKAARQEQMKQFLQTLVTQGKITQAQADARLKFMNENQGKHPQMKGGMRGMGKMGANAKVEIK